MGKILMTVSGKGGVGKSSLCVASAACLVQQGRKVILLDMDVGLRSLDILLGVEQQVVYNLGDVLAERCEPSKAVIACDDDFRLNVIAAPVDHEEPLDYKKLQVFCQTLCKHYDYVIVDIPAGLSMVFKQVAEIADLALVIATPDPISVRDAAVVANVLEKKNIPAQRLVINRVKPLPKDNIISDLDEIIDCVGIQLLGVVPENNAVSVLGSKGKIHSENIRDFTQAMQNIAARIEGYEVPLYIK